ncbi:MAG: nucleotide exchange factor GrpE [Lentisphaeria bacterium]|nr:nucleotide exchange factor GrpE [Lentisphaeria bacterium]
MDGKAKQETEVKVKVEAAAKDTAEKSSEKAEKSVAEAEKNESPETPEEKLVKLEKALLEMEDKRLRLLAEMENQRKRAVKDMEAVRYNTMTDTLHPFFQVFDHFTMAVAATETTTNMQTLLEGMKMIRAEFDRAFADLGIERIDATGKDFDPNTQEAMSQEASDTVPAGKVIRQWSFGYKMGDRLLKPANVVVSSGPAEKKENK